MYNVLSIELTISTPHATWGCASGLGGHGSGSQ